MKFCLNGSRLCSSMATKVSVPVSASRIMEFAKQPVTQLLAAVIEGDPRAQRRLWSVIYDELHTMARSQMAQEAGARTLQPTALLHEAYFRLFGDNHLEWDNRKHFFATAAKVMRQIRIDDARSRKRIKRGGGRRVEELTDEPAVWDQDPAEVLAIGEAIQRLEQSDPRKAEIVNLRYFAGMTETETAAALGVSRRTVQIDWRLARAWLHRELSGGD